MNAPNLRPRWRKVISDLWDNKLRTLLVVVSIAVGVFAVGMIAGAYAIIQSDMGLSYASANPANIELRLSPLDQEAVENLENIAGVQAAEGRRFTQVRAQVSSDEWIAIDLVAIEDYTQSEINLLRPLTGSPIPPKRQLLLEQSALEDLPVQVGSLLTIQLTDGSLRQLPVAGIVQDQTTAAGDFLAAPLGYISTDTLEWLKEPLSFNRVYLTVSEKSNDESYIRQVAAAVNDKIEKSGHQIFRTRISLRSQHPMASTVNAVLGVLGALGVLVVLLSSSLIANTLNALLNQQLRQIGVMKLIGARSSQIFGMYIGLILAFGLLALLIAIPLGGQAAYAFSQFIAGQLNFNVLGYRLIPSAILLQVIIGLVVPLAAGFIPVRSGSLISVQRAISGNLNESEIGGSPEHAGRFNRWLAAFSARFSRPLALSLRNTFRRRGRLLLTLFTLTMGGAIFIAVFNVRVTLRDYIDEIGAYFLADVTLNFNRPYRLSEIESLGRQIPGVVAIEGWSFIGGEIISANGQSIDNISILAPPAETELVDPILIAGRWLLAGDTNAVVVGESLLKHYPNLKPGDSLRLKLNGQEDDWIVVGIFKFVDREGILGYATYQHVAGLQNLPNRAVSYRLVTERHEPEYQQQIGRLVDTTFRQRGFHVNNVETGLSSLKTASEGLDTLVTFLLIMALLTALVGSMGLAGTMSMNVLERTREIGIMRSIGATDWAIIKAVLIEGVAIGLMSWCLGAILSFPISSMLSYIVSIAAFNTPIDQVFTLQGFVLWLLLVMALSILASVLPARSAARLTIREVLAYE